MNAKSDVHKKRQSKSYFLSNLIIERKAFNIVAAHGNFRIGNFCNSFTPSVENYNWHEVQERIYRERTFHVRCHVKNCSTIHISSVLSPTVKNNAQLQLWIWLRRFYHKSLLTFLMRFTSLICHSSCSCCNRRRSTVSLVKQFIFLMQGIEPSSFELQKRFFSC